MERGTTARYTALFTSLRRSSPPSACITVPLLMARDAANTIKSTTMVAGREGVKAQRQPHKDSHQSRLRPRMTSTANANFWLARHPAPCRRSSRSSLPCHGGGTNKITKSASSTGHSNSKGSSSVPAATRTHPNHEPKPTTKRYLRQAFKRKKDRIARG